MPAGWAPRACVEASRLGLQLGSLPRVGQGQESRRGGPAARARRGGIGKGVGQHRPEASRVVAPHPMPLAEVGGAVRESCASLVHRDAVAVSVPAPDRRALPRFDHQGPQPCHQLPSGRPTRSAGSLEPPERRDRETQGPPGRSAYWITPDDVEPSRRGAWQVST